MPRAGRPQVNVWLLAGVGTLVVATVVVAVALLARGSGETGVRIYDPAGGTKDEVRTADIVKSSVEVSGVSGIWLLGFQLTPAGAREFHRLTRSLAQRGAQAGHPQPYAFAVDGHVYARPTVDYHSLATASRTARGSRYRGCAVTSRSVSRWRCASRSSRPSRQGASRRPRRRPPQGRRPRRSRPAARTPAPSRLPARPNAGARTPSASSVTEQPEGPPLRTRPLWAWPG